MRKTIELLAAAVLLLPQIAPAQEIGRVIMTRGQVAARAADGSMRTLARRSALLVGDAVLTDPGSIAQIRMIDDAAFSIGGDTEFTFAEYVFDGDPATADSALMKLAQGCFRAISGQIAAAPDTYGVDTPVATITIRGTVHGGVYDGAALYTATYEGGTTVSNSYGSLDLGIGGAYEFSVTAAGTAPVGLVTPPAQVGMAGCSSTSPASTAASLPMSATDDAPSTDFSSGP